MGRNWSRTCAMNHDPARRRIEERVKNGKTYNVQRCPDCDEIHHLNREAAAIRRGSDLSTDTKLRNAGLR